MINYALTTKTRVKARLGITVTSFDDLLDTMIAAVTNKIEQMAGRRFLATTYTNEVYDGVDAYDESLGILVANNAPILTLTSFQYKSGGNDNPTWNDFSVNDYDQNLRLGVLHMAGRLPKGRQNIRLSYRAGYLIDFTNTTTFYDEATHTLPYDLTEVCEEAVVRLFKKREAEGRQQESFNESSVTWNADIFTKENLATINNYRRVVL